MPHSKPQYFPPSRKATPQFKAACKSSDSYTAVWINKKTQENESYLILPF